MPSGIVFAKYTIIMKLIFALIFLFFGTSAFGQGPEYDPEAFYSGIENDSKINCLSYALNLKKDTPVVASSWFNPSAKKQDLLSNVVSQVNSIHGKGLPSSAPLGKIVTDGRADPGYYLVAFYISHSENDEDGCLDDYHFARQDRDGGWSHKTGKKIPTNKDASGKVISDPATADLHYEYTEERGELFAEYKLVGYFQVRDPDLRSSPSDSSSPISVPSGVCRLETPSISPEVVTLKSSVDGIREGDF